MLSIRLYNDMNLTVARTRFCLCKPFIDKYLDRGSPMVPVLGLALLLALSAHRIHGLVVSAHGWVISFFPVPTDLLHEPCWAKGLFGRPRFSLINICRFPCTVRHLQHP